MQNRVRLYFIDYFANRLLLSITRQDLKSFALFLAKPRKRPENHKGHYAEKLSAAYLNSILLVGKIALKWTFNEGLIPSDPTAGIKKISGEAKKRGILTQAETEKIFHFINRLNINIRIRVIAI